MMRRHSALLPILLLIGCAMPAKSEAKVWSTTKADQKAFEWCISHFLSLDHESSQQDEKDIRPIARPVWTLRPLNTENMLVPADLIRETEIVGALPPEIEKYRGLWIWPTIDTPSPSAIFVERLSSAEITIVEVRKNVPTNHDNPRRTLKWDGQVFGGGVGRSIVLSSNGEAMLLIVESEWEAMPAGCFISSRNY